MRGVWFARLGALSPRARRALGLMLIAGVAVSVVSLLYLRPWTALQPSAAAIPNPSLPPTLRSGFFASYSFVSPAVGWTVQVDTSQQAEAGPFWVFKTVDSGRHWRRQLFEETAALSTTAFSLQFVDVRTGYVIGANPLLLYRTKDGGDHWSKLDLPSPNADSVKFLDASRGFAVAREAKEPPGPPVVFETADGGETWMRRPNVPSNSAFWPLWRTASEWWSGAAGIEGPYVFLTTDGGVTWSRRKLPVEPDLPVGVTTGVEFVPHSSLVVVFEYADRPGPIHFYSTVDRGASWTKLTPPSQSNEFGGFAYIDATRWWAIQDLALYKTADGAHTWFRSAAVPPNLRLLQVMDSTHAWGEFDEGYGTELVATSDGGSHWTTMHVPTPTVTGGS